MAARTPLEAVEQDHERLRGIAVDPVHVDEVTVGVVRRLRR